MSMQDPKERAISNTICTEEEFQDFRTHMRPMFPTLTDAELDNFIDCGVHFFTIRGESYRIALDTWLD
jgi:hypothetical protein